MNVQPIWVICSPPPTQISSAHGVTLLWSSQYLRLPLRTRAEALMSKGFPLLAARALCPVQRNILHLCTPHVLGHTAQPRYTLGSLSGIFCSAVSFFLLQRAAEELCSWLPGAQSTSTNAAFTPERVQWRGQDFTVPGLRVWPSTQHSAMKFVLSGFIPISVTIPIFLGDTILHIQVI